MEQISIIVPCYNEQEALPYFSKEIIRIADQLPAYEFQIVFVNDGSKDKTLELLKSYEKSDPRIHYISFSQKFWEMRLQCMLDFASNRRLCCCHGR